jgi:hypothetical protein
MVIHRPMSRLYVFADEAPREHVDDCKKIRQVYRTGRGRLPPGAEVFWA